MTRTRTGVGAIAADVHATETRVPGAQARTPADGPEGAPPVTGPAAPSALREPRARVPLRRHLGTLAGLVVLGAVTWRLGTGAFLDGLRRVDAPAILGALGIGLVTTVFSAWRWRLVARGLRIGLPLGTAVADYYRALFLNAALPGGVLGDVHRAVRHGRSAGDLGRGVRAVVLERTAGQAVLAVAGGIVLATVPSPVRDETRQLAALAAVAAAGAGAIAAALRMSRPRAAARRGRALLAEAREALLSRRNGPGVLGASAVVLAGHLAMFLLAARITRTGASALVLLPLGVLALLAMSLPLNVGGWGPREGVTAWAFGAAGLGAGHGLAVAVVYGVLSFAASLPGAAVIALRSYGVRRVRGTTDPSPPGAGTDPPPSGASSEKYVPKDSPRLASNAFPFSADPREGRPMTPESV
ncbi:hypothetical protein SUDANB96_05636 [Streptomyces sp. enrichment culture]